MPAPTPADELRFAHTDDRWRLALHRYRARGARRRHAVVCCHGLGANHLAFDVDPDASLARHLAGRGYEVLSLDLRGHGRSDRPSLFGGERRFGWAFDDYLTRDVPAAIHEAASVAGSDEVHWIGHSMGGLLLFAHLARGGSPRVRSGIAVGSSLDYSISRSGFHGMLALERLLTLVPAVPIGLVGRAMAPLVGRWSSPFERFNVWPSNVDPRLWRRVSASGFHPVSAPVMAQLASAMRPGGLRSRDGSVRYLAGLGGATAPVLSIAGDRDAQCPPDAAKHTLDALGSSRKELAVFGPDHGHADHYGHFDLLMGRRVRDEVFPRIERWLDEHDAP